MVLANWSFVVFIHWSLYCQTELLLYWCLGMLLNQVMQLNLSATPPVPKYKNVFNTTLMSKTFLYYGTEGVHVNLALWYLFTIVYLMLDGNCYSYKTINLRYYHNSEKWDVHICLYFDLLMVSFMWMFYCIIWFLICSKCDTSLSFIIVWSEPRQQLAGRGSVVPEGEVWGCAWEDLQAGGDGFSIHLFSPWSPLLWCIC